MEMTRETKDNEDTISKSESRFATLYIYVFAIVPFQRVVSVSAPFLFGPVATVARTTTAIAMDTQHQCEKGGD